MKKIMFLLIVAVIAMSVLFAGCADNLQRTQNDEGDKNVEQNVTTDYMEKYIADLPNDTARNNFLGFFNSMCSYCFDIELTFEREGNTSAYEFDPSNSETIPVEIKNKYNFEKMKFFNGYTDHKDYNMRIDGNKVEFSFDGEVFYPTTYGYEEVRALIEKYNA